MSCLEDSKLWYCIVRAARYLFSRMPLRSWSPSLNSARSTPSPRRRPDQSWGAQASSEPEIHAERQRNVVRGLAIQGERRRFLEIELAEIVLGHQPDAEVRIEAHVDATAEVVRDVRGLGVQEPGRHLIADRADTTLHER